MGNELIVREQDTSEIEIIKKDIETYFEKKQKYIIKALPQHISPSRMLKVCLFEICRDKKLLECSKKSLFTAMMQSSQLGLMPDKFTGMAYLIPYFNKEIKKYECQLMIGYKGMITLAYQSGQTVSIKAVVVYNDDFFEYEEGTAQTLKHKPNLDGNREDENIKCVYAIARLKGCYLDSFCVLSRNEIEKRRSISKRAYAENSPWITFYTEMAKKTAIRALCKYLPQSTDNLNLYKAIAIDEATEIGKNIIDVEFSDEIDEDTTTEQKQVYSNVVLNELKNQENNKVT